MSLSTPVTDRASSVVAIVAGLSLGDSDSRSAAAPATWGVAIEVPLNTAVEPLSAFEVMETPGAKRSTQDPVLENHARSSAASTAPTVRALVTRLGDRLQALPPLLPAATTTVTPSAMVARTASSTRSLGERPRLTLATAGALAAWLRMIQLSPLITPLAVPPPLQSRTRTGTSVTALATP